MNNVSVNLGLNVWGFPMAKPDCAHVLEMIRDMDGEVDMIHIASSLGSEVGRSL